MRIAALVLSLLFTTTPAFAYWIRDCKTDVIWSGQTKLVVDMNPGTGSTVDMLYGFGHRNEYMAEFQGKLYFQGRNPNAGSELFLIKPDGLPHQVADLATGSASSSPHSFVVFQDALFFAAATAASGEELVRYNDSSTKTFETVPGPEGADLSALTVYGDAIYFLRTANGKQQLWRFNGTAAEPVNAVNGAAGSIEDSSVLAAPLVVFKGKLYFVRDTPLPENYELWSYDGTSAVKVKALTPGNNGTSRDFNLGVYKGHLYFGVVALADDLFDQDQLWRYDGQSAPVKLFSVPGNASSGSQPAEFVVYKDALYFTAGPGFWRYDGTSVEQIDDASGFPSQLRALSRFESANLLFLRGYYGNWTDSEPFIYDGVGITQVKEIKDDDAEGNPGSFPSYGLDVDGEFYFFAEDETHGRELWRTESSERITLKCDIVVAPIWDDWRRWPIERRDVIVATWAIGPNGRRLISREAVTVTPRQEARVSVLELNTRRQTTPEAFALATVVFDRETGRVLDSGYDVVGSAGARRRVQLERAAAGIVKGAAMREAMAERIQRE